jgi:hypothetical protein
LITDGEEHLFSIHAEKINATSDFIPITDCWIIYWRALCPPIFFIYRIHIIHMDRKKH